MKKPQFAIIALILTAALISGCGIKININPAKVDESQLIEENVLTADPVKYNSNGEYQITLHSPRNLKEMDLSQAYVAYDDFYGTAEEPNDEEDINHLPQFVIDTMNDSSGSDHKNRLAIVTVETQDEETLRISFKDPENPKGRTYFFIIPNESLAGVISVE